MKRWIREEHLSLDATMREFCYNMNRWIWKRNNTFRTVKIFHKGLSCFFEPKLVFISQPEHCYLSSGYWTNFQPLPTIFCQKWGKARSMKSKESVCKSLTYCSTLKRLFLVFWYCKKKKLAHRANTQIWNKSPPAVPPEDDLQSLPTSFL